MKKPRWRKFAVAVCGTLTLGGSQAAMAENGPPSGPAAAGRTDGDAPVEHQEGRLVTVEGNKLTLVSGDKQYRFALPTGQSCSYRTGDYIGVDFRDGNRIVEVARALDPDQPDVRPSPDPAAPIEQQGTDVPVPAPKVPAATDNPSPGTEVSPGPAPVESPTLPPTEGNPAGSPVVPAETPAAPAAGETPAAPPAGETPEMPAAPETPAPPAGGQTPPPDKVTPGETQTRIVNIEIEGNTHVPTEEVLQVISTRIGDPLLEPRLKRDAQAIFDLGYFTDVRLDYRLAPGGVRLVFRVLENPVVSEVRVVGSNVVGSDKVVGLMETKPGKILNTRFLRSDVEAVNQYFNEELGYLLNNHVEDLTFEKGILTLKVRDGLKIQQVVIEGVTVFPIEKIQSLVRLRPGDLFNKKTSDLDGAAVAKLYEDNDYILDTIRPTIDPDKGIVTYKVQEATLQEVRVEGNSRTTTDTVLRNMRSKPGEVLKRKRIQRDLERLQSLGFFKKVDINPEPGTEPGKVILVLDVEEQKSGLATIGLGYAGGGTGALRPGITGSVSLSDRNLFGEGKTYNLQLQAGGQVRSAGLSYLDPAINGNQDSFGVSVYYSELLGVQQNVNVNGNSEYAYYDDERYGISATYGHPITDDMRGFVTLRHDELDIRQDVTSTFTPLGLGRGDINAVSLNAIYDTRDDLFNPHVGTYTSGAITHSGFGGVFEFDKYTAEIRHYVPLGDRQTIALRAWAGQVTGGNIPGSEYFYAGGVDTLRAFQQNRFVGTKFIVMNAEFRFPLFNIKFLNGAVFGDVGNAWLPGVTSGDLHYDGGAGLRIVFPSLGLGVIRLDYAVGDEGGRFSIGIGQSF